MNAFDFGRVLQKTAAGSIFSNYQQRKDLAGSAMKKLMQPQPAGAPVPATPTDAPAAPAAQPGGGFPGPVGSWLPGPDAWAHQGSRPAAGLGAPAAPAAPGAPRPGVFGNRPSFNAQQQSTLDAARARQRAMIQGAQ